MGTYVPTYPPPVTSLLGTPVEMSSGPAHYNNRHGISTGRAPGRIYYNNRHGPRHGIATNTTTTTAVADNIGDYYYEDESGINQVSSSF